MPEPSYSKPFLPIDKQVELLRDRGLIIDDHDAAQQQLKHIGFWRLQRYCRAFYENPNKQKFREGTTFKNLINIYAFDNELRLLVFEGIGKFEISFRSNFNYHLAEESPLAHYDASLFKDGARHKESLKILKLSLRNSKSADVRAFRNRHGGKGLPIWVCTEVLTFGEISKLYDNFRDTALKGEVAHDYGVAEFVFGNWVRHFNDLRNVCAHHEVLWIKKLVKALLIPKVPPPSTVDAFNKKRRRRLYNSLIALAYLVKEIDPDTSWKERLRTLLTEHKNEVPLDRMGVPPNWEEAGFWNRECAWCYTLITMDDDDKWLDDRLGRFIERVGDLTQDTYQDWIAGVKGFLAENYEDYDVAKKFHELCGEEVREVAPARQYLARLRDSI